MSTKRVIQTTSILSSGEDLDSNFSDLNAGGSAKVNWRTGRHNLLAGVDYDDGTLDSNAVTNGRQGLVKWALFANDTMALASSPSLPGSGTTIPAATAISSARASASPMPSPGADHRPGYVARGFNTPPLSATFGNATDLRGIPSGVANPGISGWKRSGPIPLGVETTLLKYFWFKTNVFIHDVRDVIGHESYPLPNRFRRSTAAGSAGRGSRWS